MPGDVFKSDGLRRYWPAACPGSFVSPQLVAVLLPVPPSIWFGRERTATGRQKISDRATGSLGRQCQMCDAAVYKTSALCHPCYLALRKALVVVRCVHCGEVMQRALYDYSKSLKHGRSVAFCSMACRNKARGHGPKACKGCGKTLDQKGRYCTEACKARHRPPRPRADWAGTKRQCPVCSTTFVIKTRIQQYCSRACASLGHGQRMSSPFNPWWRNGGGMDPAHYGYHKDFYAARKKVLLRDENRCARCGQEVFGQKAHVHHIDLSRKNNDPRNLITLCASCHITGHKSKTISSWGLSDLACKRQTSLTSRSRKITTS